MDFQIPAPVKIRRRAEKPRPMQFAIIPLRAIADGRLTDRQVRVLGLIASYCNRAGITWATQETLGRQMGMSRAGMGKHMNNLAALGYLEKIGGYKRAVKGWTWRVLFDPKLTAEQAAAIAQPEEETMKENFTHGAPMPIGAFTGQIKASLDRRRRKQADAAAPQAPKVAEEARASEADYLREYQKQIASMFGIERVASEPDRAGAARLAAAGVPMATWSALLAESLAWHRDNGRVPPAGIGYWLQAALASV